MTQDDQLDIFGGLMEEAEKNAIPYPPTFEQQLDWVNKQLNPILTEDRVCMICQSLKNCKKCCKTCLDCELTGHPCPEYDVDLYYELKRKGKL